MTTTPVANRERAQAATVEDVDVASGGHDNLSCRAICEMLAVRSSR